MGIYNSKEFIARAICTLGVRNAAPETPKTPTKTQNSSILATAGDFL